MLETVVMSISNKIQTYQTSLRIASFKNPLFESSLSSSTSLLKNASLIALLCGESSDSIELLLLDALDMLVDAGPPRAGEVGYDGLLVATAETAARSFEAVGDSAPSRCPLLLVLLLRVPLLGRAGLPGALLLLDLASLVLMPTLTKLSSMPATKAGVICILAGLKSSGLCRPVWHQCPSSYETGSRQSANGKKGCPRARADCNRKGRRLSKEQHA